MEQESSNNETTTMEVESYESVVTKVFEEERRLQNLCRQNSVLLPNKSKKSYCTLPINQKAMKYFQKKTNDISITFEQYITERREVESSVLTLLQQCSQFISYLEMTLNNNKMETLELIFHVITDHSLLFHQYFQFLKDHGLKSSTILLRLNSIYHLIQWLRMIQNRHFNELSHVLDRLVIDRNRFNAITTMDQKKKTLESLIQARQWVEGGLSSIQNMMLDSWPYFEALVSLSKYQELKKHQYSWALGFTLSTLWVYGFNARAKSIEFMTMKDYKDMEENQFHLSINFKTSSTYGYQIVSPTDVLKIYVQFIRKQIIPEDIDSDEATLFPTSVKTPLSQGEISKKINLVFKKYGYDLCVTKLRDILSTHIEELHSSNAITPTGN